MSMPSSCRCTCNMPPWVSRVRSNSHWHRHKWQAVPAAPVDDSSVVAAVLGRAPGKRDSESGQASAVVRDPSGTRWTPRRRCVTTSGTGISRPPPPVRQSDSTGSFRAWIVVALCLGNR